MLFGSDVNFNEVTPNLQNESFKEPVITYSCVRINGAGTLRVCDLPASERPRERLLASGGAYLSNADLLSILLGTGQGDQSAIDLAHTLLASLEDNGQRAIVAFRNITPQKLMEQFGIGEAKAATILAAVELGKRVHTPSPMIGSVIDAPDLAVQALASDLMWSSVEKFAIVMLDIKHRLISKKILSVGSATEAIADPREIFKALLEANAVRAIVAHNHPSGSMEPSSNDIELTEHLLKAAKIMNIPILDHLILGGGSYLSLRQTTTLWMIHPQESLNPEPLL